MFIKNLKKYREKAGMTQTEISKRLLMSQQGYAKYETGKSSPDPDRLREIANILNCSVEDLTESSSSNNKATKIPVFSQVAAGIPISAIEDIIDYEEISEQMANQGEYFGLRIKGDSMEPRIRTGDVVIVRKQETIENGEVAIVLINGEEGTCKKIKKTPEGVYLLSLNQAYEPIFYTNKEIEELPVQIVGKVVELRGKF